MFQLLVDLDFARFFRLPLGNQFPDFTIQIDRRQVCLLELDKPHKAIAHFFQFGDLADNRRDKLFHLVRLNLIFGFDFVKQLFGVKLNGSQRIFNPVRQSLGDLCPVLDLADVLLLSQVEDHEAVGFEAE